MKIMAPYDYVKLSQTEPGDLIHIMGGGGLLGLVLKLEQGQRVIGILSDPSRHEPYHVVYQRDLECLRYREGWILRLAPEDAVYNSSQYYDRAGVIHIGQTGTVMNFGTVDNRVNELTVNLTSFEWDDIPSKSATFPKWKIWASESDIFREGSAPHFHL